MNAQTARTVTLVLGAICGALALFGATQRFGVGRGYHWNDDSGVAPAPLPAHRIDREIAALPAESQFIEIQNRPLFNDDRKPTPPETAETAEEAPPQVPLNVTLTGIIITPDVKLAMLRANNGRGDPVSLHEGMPLPGDQSVWTVVEIQPRKIVLKSGNDETSELPLDVSPVTPPAPTPRVAAAPPPPAPSTAPSAVVAPPPIGSDQASPAPNPSDRAAELQKRIEERRREMREQAERLRQQQSQQMQQDQQTE